MKQFVFSVLCLCGFFASLGVCKAYEVENLSPSSVSLARGTGFVHAGVGLRQTASTALSVSVPSSVQIKQVLLYWQGLGSRDSTVRVNTQHVVRGELLGDSNPFLHPASSFRADITALNLVRSGVSVLDVTGYRFGHRNMGAHVVVVVDDGTGARPLFLRDGLDYVYGGAPEGSLSKVSREQEFVFEPACVPREAVLSLAGGGGLASAYDEVVVTVGTEAFVYRNVFRSSSGSHWDVLRYPVFIPPTVSRVKVKVVTRADVASGMGADSLAWVLASLEGPCESCASSASVAGSNRMSCFSVNEVSVYQAYQGIRNGVSPVFQFHTAHLAGYFIVSSGVSLAMGASSMEAMLNFNQLHLEAPKGGWTERGEGWLGYTHEDFSTGLLWEFRVHPFTGAWEFDYNGSEQGMMQGSMDLDVRMSFAGKKGNDLVQTTGIVEDFVGQRWLYDEPLHETCAASVSSCLR